MPTIKSILFVVSKDEWDTKEDNSAENISLKTWFYTVPNQYFPSII